MLVIPSALRDGLWADKDEELPVQKKHTRQLRVCGHWLLTHFFIAGNTFLRLLLNFFFYLFLFFLTDVKFNIATTSMLLYNPGRGDKMHKAPSPLLAEGH